MDDIVRQAMAKWPNVPDCTGWLGLDARGNWYMRDDRVQAQGAFAQHKGARLTHDKLIAFIARNYDSDAQGRWYFQNGPQRVFVELESTPWVWRVSAHGQVHSHTGVDVQVLHTWLDEAGHLYLYTDRGVGLVHSQDMLYAAQQVESGAWTPQPLQQAQVPQHFGFVRSPHALALATKKPAA